MTKNGQKTNMRFEPVNRNWGQLVLLVLIIGYWLLAWWLERIDLNQALPGMWAEWGQRMPMLDLFSSYVSVFVWPAEMLSPRVLRHFIPAVFGWWMARVVTVRMLKILYDLPGENAAGQLLNRLQANRLPFGPPVQLNREKFAELVEKHQVLRIGGPGKVLIQPGDVLVTERNGRFYRVLGPGMSVLHRFEYARAMLDLRPQEREDKAVKLVTSDGIQLTAEVSITFQISRGDQTPTMARPHPYSPDAVRKAAYTYTDLGSGKYSLWDSLPIIIISGKLADIVAEYRLDELIFPEQRPDDPHRNLKENMERRARPVLAGFGIDIIDTRLGRLEMPEPVTSQHIAYWQAYWDKQRRLRQADGEVQAMEEANEARIEAEAVMLRAIVEGLQRGQDIGAIRAPRQVVALRFIEALEGMARQSEEVVPLPNNLLPQLGNLRQQLLLKSGAKDE